MKKYIVFLLLIQCIGASLNAQVWRSKTIDKNISILFPSDPTESSDNGQTAFSYIDSKGVYVASIQDMKIVMPSGFRSKDEVNGFYKEMVNVTLKKYNGKLIHTKDFYIRGLKGLEMEFTFSHKSTFTEQRFSRFLVLPDKTIILQFSSPIDIADANVINRKHFFDSLELKDKDDDLWQYDEGKSTIAYIVGYLIGRLLPVFAVIIIGLTVIVIIIVRRNNRL
jgi:hypothetical protein